LNLAIVDCLIVLRGGNFNGWFVGLGVKVIDSVGGSSEYIIFFRPVLDCFFPALVLGIGKIGRIVSLGVILINIMEN
jgi:hypothetical protein